MRIITGLISVFYVVIRYTRKSCAKSITGVILSKRGYTAINIPPKKMGDYLVEFKHNVIKGEVVHHICFYEPGVGWCNNIPDCCKCKNIKDSFSMNLAIAWRRIPTLVDDLKRK